MNLQIIIAALIAAAGFGSAWKIQDWRMTAKENDRAEQILADQRLAAATAIRRADNVIAAQNQAELRARVLRSNAAVARNELDGLRATTAETVRAASASTNACLERAAALGELLVTSADQYRDLAEKADRHTNDIQRLMAAWPVKEQTP